MMLPYLIQVDDDIFMVATPDPDLIDTVVRDRCESLGVPVPYDWSWSAVPMQEMTDDELADAQLGRPR